MDKINRYYTEFNQNKDSKDLYGETKDGSINMAKEVIKSGQYVFQAIKNAVSDNKIDHVGHDQMFQKTDVIQTMKSLSELISQIKSNDDPSLINNANSISLNYIHRMAKLLESDQTSKNIFDRNKVFPFSLKATFESAIMNARLIDNIKGNASPTFTTKINSMFGKISEIYHKRGFDGLVADKRFMYGAAVVIAGSLSLYALYKFGSNILQKIKSWWKNRRYRSDHEWF